MKCDGTRAEINFFSGRNGRVHLNRRGRQFSPQLSAEVCASAVVMLDTPCSEVVWRVLATHSIRRFLLHFPSRASPCAITFQLESRSAVHKLRTNRPTRSDQVSRIPLFRRYSVTIYINNACTFFFCYFISYIHYDPNFCPVTVKFRNVQAMKACGVVEV